MQSEQVRQYLKEILEVGMRHNLMLTVSGYDGFQVWPLQDDGQSLDHLMNAEDCTQPDSKVIT